MPPFKTLRIIGKRHRIKWDQQLKDSFGECDQNECEVRLAAELAHDQLRETLLHEVMHAICMQMNCDIPEEQHRQLSIGLYAVLRDNPKLVEFLTEEEVVDE